MKVSGDKLLLVAGCVWFAAGANILLIGLQAADGSWSPLMDVLALVVFLAFHVMIFTKLVHKHDARIRGYGSDKMPMHRFFDKKSYLIMAFMMTLGITLRLSGLVPDFGIAFFYTGLGLSLVIAGLGFIGHYLLDGRLGIIEKLEMERLPEAE